jgi:hypothetical protein
MNLNSWKLILATVVIFFAGMITGGLVVQHVSRAGVESAEPAPPPAEPPVRVAPPQTPAQPPVPEVPLPRLAERLSKEFVKRLDKSLRLTPEQHAAIAKIVADGQERNHAIWTNVAPQVAPQMRQVMQDVHRQIREHLTPAQLKQFEELMKQPAKSKTELPEKSQVVKSHSTNRPAGSGNADLTAQQMERQALKQAGEERLRTLTNAAPAPLPPPAATNATGV